LKEKRRCRAIDTDVYIMLTYPALEKGIIEKLLIKKPRGLPPALPVPEGMAQQFLEEDRNR
jgi:hypothetical protein